MGKLLHKFVHGIMPSWLFTRFKRTNTAYKKLLHFKPRHSNSIKSFAPMLPSSSTPLDTESSSPTLPSSSTPLDPEVISLLTDMDQSTYYYSQSEGEEERPITGCNNHLSSPSIESKSLCDDDDSADDSGDHHHASHNPRMGICALAATSIIQGRWHEDKHEPPPFANDEIKYLTSPSSITLQSRHDNDDYRYVNQQEDCRNHLYPTIKRNHIRSSRGTGIMKRCLYASGHCSHGCHHQHQHQPQNDDNHEQHHVADGGIHVNQSLQHHGVEGPHTNQHLRCNGDDTSLCHQDNNVCHHNDQHVYDFHHLHQTYSCNNQLFTTRNGRPNPSIGSHPIISPLAITTKTGNQHNYDHCHPHHYQHDCSNSNYHQLHLAGMKRKRICLDEDDGKADDKGSIRTWPCLKRQKTYEEDNKAYELPECISEMVGRGSAVVKYSYQNPLFAFWESMVEMIESKELWSGAELEFLLNCYLVLNEPHLHHTIHTSFIQVLKDL